LGVRLSLSCSYQLYDVIALVPSLTYSSIWGATSYAMRFANFPVHSTLTVGLTKKKEWPIRKWGSRFRLMASKSCTASSDCWLAVPYQLVISDAEAGTSKNRKRRRMA